MVSPESSVTTDFGNAETFEWSKRSEPGDDAVQQAFRFLFRNRFSRGGLG